MEIKDPVHGAIQLSEAEEAILESQEFQRLRQIKQLGFAEYSFPGGTHSRYLHSIGVMHLAGLAFDSVFKKFKFSNQGARERLKQALRLGALLHDVGHGPLSHTTETVMPELSLLKIKAYANRERGWPIDLSRTATHEDYSIKILTESSVTEIIQNRTSFDGIHVAALIDRGLKLTDDFFIEQGVDFRPILSQIISSEMDVDRMDYLERDAYFCGTNYGRVELGWLLGNLSYYQKKDKLFLALNRKAIYTFDDFLISRHHMYLMVYFHHKSIIFEEMLQRYLESERCAFTLPADLQHYLRCTDSSLYEHLAGQENEWAHRIAHRQPYRMLLELHTTEPTLRVKKISELLMQRGIAVIQASSKTRLSKYHATHDQEAFPIYVVDDYDFKSQPVPIERVTRVFQKYEETRVIDRVYVAPEKLNQAKRILHESKL